MSQDITTAVNRGVPQHLPMRPGSGTDDVGIPRGTVAPPSVVGIQRADPGEERSIAEGGAAPAVLVAAVAQRSSNPR
jgi:hypothetical protein